MTNIGMIFRSRWMVAGVICEILAFIAAVGNWFAGSWFVWQLLPNVALTLATLGADYGRRSGGLGLPRAGVKRKATGRSERYCVKFRPEPDAKGRNHAGY